MRQSRYFLCLHQRVLLSPTLIDTITGSGHNLGSSSACRPMPIIFITVSIAENRSWREGVYSMNELFERKKDSWSSCSYKGSLWICIAIACICCKAHEFWVHKCFTEETNRIVWSDGLIFEAFVSIVCCRYCSRQITHWRKHRSAWG